MFVNFVYMCVCVCVWVYVDVLDDGCIVFF